jgi:tetratricopeptide (TPR) repeat protein
MSSEAERLMQLGGRANFERVVALAWENDPEMLFRAAYALWAVDANAESMRAVRRLREVIDEDFIFLADLMHLVGLLARDAGRDDEAEKALRAAFDLAPETEDHGRWLAGLLIDHERHDEALDVVQRALEHRPGDAALLELRDWLLEPDSRR